ncbi:MAG: CheY-like chemotaxis protein [Litorivivens sp.]|jgi:CheY-like chemotaxis protein
MLKASYEGLDFDVIEAADDEECLVLFELHKASIVLVTLDINMPKMNGWQCLQSIRQQSAKLPILIISGYDPEAKEIPVDDHHVHYLSKPFGLKQLKTATEALQAIE